MLRNGRHLDGLAGVVVGQYTDCGPEPNEPTTWTELDVLEHHLSSLGVPILGGLPIGHGLDPHTVAIGSLATLDADAGTLRVGPAVS